MDAEEADTPTPRLAGAVRRVNVGDPGRTIKKIHTFTPDDDFESDQSVDSGGETREIERKDFRETDLLPFDGDDPKAADDDDEGCTERVDVELDFDNNTDAVDPINEGPWEDDKSDNYVSSDLAEQPIVRPTSDGADAVPSFRSEYSERFRDPTLWMADDVAASLWRESAAARPAEVLTSGAHENPRARAAEKAKMLAFQDLRQKALA